MRKQVELKKAVVNEIVDHIKNSVSAVVVDYRGLNVKQDTALRKNFRENDVVYKVYKNRLLARALNEVGITSYDTSLLEGTTSIAFAKDEVTAARLFSQAQKDYKKIDVKFGLLNGAIISKSDVENLSKLPSKPVLISMLLGMLQAPASSLARALNEVANKG